MKIYDSERSLRELSWEDVYEMYATDCPNFLLLVDYLLTMPSSSVDAERGFSRMKFVKNDWRSRLGEKNLTDLMLLYMESPSVSDFDPADSVHHWYTSGQRCRRPNYMEDIMNCSEPDIDLLDDDNEDDDKQDEVAFDFEQEIDIINQTTAEDRETESSDIDMNLHDIMLMQRKKYQMFCELMGE